MAKDTRWDRNLSVAADAEGLIGHAGAVLLRKLADQCGLTPALGAALGRAGKFPLIDRGMAVAIALGARRMNDIALLAHQEPVFGGRAERYHDAADAGAGRRPDPRQDRPGAGEAAGAVIYFADEADVHSDYHAGTTWSPVGQTPVVKNTRQPVLGEHDLRRLGEGRAPVRRL